MRRWVLHKCYNNKWTVENWIYTDHDAAMYWAETHMDKEADAVIVEDITNSCMTKQGGYLTLQSLAQLGCTWWNLDPWNFKQEDFFKGVRIREHHRKKHKAE